MSKSIFKSYKFYLIIGLVFFSGVYLLLSIYGSQLAKDIISRVVKVQTDNSYNVEFKKVDLSIIDRKLTIDSMYLTPIRRANQVEASNTYQILAPKLILDLKSVTSIFLNKELSIEQIAVYNPKLSIVKGNKQSPKNITFEAGDLYQLISRYIKVFEVGQLLIQQGGINFINDHSSNNNFELMNLDFLVENFLMDSTKSNDRYFFTDRIKLVLTNQNFLLNDDIHTLHFDTLTVSTRQKILEFSGFNIRPSENSGDSTNLYNIDIPNFTLKKVDFDGIYIDNKVSIGKCISQGGSINIKLNKASSNSEVGDRKFQFPKLNHRLTLQNFDIKFNRSNIIFGNDTLSFGQINLRGDSLGLDSTSAFDDLQPLLSAVSLSLVDTEFANAQFHSTADSIIYSLADKNIHLSNFNFSNANSSFIIPATDILLSNSRTDGLNISCLELNKASIFIEPNSEKTPVSQSLFPEWLDIQCLKLKNANLKYADIFLMNNIDADLLIDKKVFKNIRNFKKHLPKYNIASGSWQLMSDELSVNGNTFQINNFGETSLTRLKINTEITDLSLEQVQLSGLHLDSLLFHKKLSLNTLKITNPEGQFSMKNQQSPSTIQYSYNTIDVTNGTLVIDLPQDKKVFLNKINFKSSKENNKYFSLINVDSGIATGFKEYKIAFQKLVLNEELEQLSIKKINLSPSLTDSKSKLYADAHHFNLVNFNLENIKHATDPISIGIIDVDSLAIYGVFEQRPKEQKQPNKRTLTLDHFRIKNLNSNLTFGDDQLQIVDAIIDVTNFDSSKKDILKDNKILFSGNQVNFKTKEINSFFDSVFVNTYSHNVRTKSGKIQINKDSIYFDSINLLNVDFSPENDTFSISNISLDNPTFQFDLTKRKDKKERSVPKFFILDSIQITNATAHLLNTGIKNNKDLNIKAINFNTQGLHFSSDFNHLKYNSVQLATGELNFTTPDSLYRLSMKSLNFNDLGDIKLSQIVLDPIYNRRDFNEHIDHQKDWFSGSLRNLYIYKWDIKKFLNDSVVSVRKIVLDNLYLETHKDKRKPEPPKKVKALPQQYLKDLSFELTVDTIDIVNSYVSHSEYSPTGIRPGFIYFKGINGSLTNITNNQEAIAKNNILTFVARGTLFKTGNFSLKSDFHLNDPKNKFDMTARVGNMDLTEMNALLENTAHISIKSGMNRLNELNFQANDHYALGLMKFYYKDLKIAVLKENANHEEENASFKSFFANAFIVNKKNPHFLFVRKGDIYFERNEEKAIFNYWAKSILSGVITSIGAGNNRKEIRELNKNSKEKF